MQNLPLIGWIQLLFFLVLICMILRWSESDIQFYIFAPTSITVWFKLLSYSRGFTNTGTYVKLILAVTRSIFFFLVILLLVIFAFSHAFKMLAIIDTDNFDQYDSVGSSILTQYRMIIGDFDISSFLSPTEASQGIGIVFFIAFTLLVSIILLNLLIAIMSNSYDNIQENAKAEWLAELAEILIEIDHFFLLPSEKNNKKFFPKFVRCWIPVSTILNPNEQKNLTLDNLDERMEDIKSQMKETKTDLDSQMKEIKSQMKEIKDILIARLNVPLDQPKKEKD